MATILKNKKQVFRSSQQQQSEAPAFELDNTVLIDDSGPHPTEGMYEDLFDGMDKKTLYVKNMDRQNSLTRG